MHLIEIELSAIITDDSAQIRVAGTNPEVVAEYAEALQHGAVFPPVVLFNDGNTDSSYFAADGFHRIAAARAIGKPTISAEVRHGTLRDAIIFAAGANSTHGLRRTNADKRRAVTVLLSDPQWSKWSDRKIGEAVGVDHKTVGAIRRELTSGEIPHRKTIPKNTSGEIPHAKPVDVGSSMVARLFASLSDEALIAECRRRGLEVL
ncbi:hypothetical protein GOD34_18350 [Sinorhizobium medicae]|uniref:ParB/RepB/Spo0J family partition protein n=1 Tax=Sinorhizobium medicae TaxID=110321 RepID=UPI000FDAE097|nr:ParB/RepB/Spo0J family partition protein [Sinorhizobium medicae]MDX0438934.1 hypothetical protein [Sinorhizobium medicae]MDX0652728.1 hypothetical protein [Sinorhizobium medicae]MDX1156598.1 hypothetical protein [Sinorhizobium medicae]RVJ10227.1 hypothetical protein CN181_11215 [Sinorhizobium medicae]